MRNYATRLARLRELKPPPSPPGPPWAYTELAANIETLLEAARGDPNYKLGRYTLHHLAGLAIACFEDALKRRAGIPGYCGIEPVALIAEERLTLLVENMGPQQLKMLYGLLGGPEPEIAWVGTHYVLKTVPGLGDQDEVHQAADVAGRFGRLEAVSPIEEIATIPTLEPTPGPGPGPEPTAGPGPEPTAGPGPGPEARPKPQLLGGGELRPMRWLTGPWR